MTYNCTVEKMDDGKFLVRFPDMTNILTCGTSLENALEMAGEALDGVLAELTDLDTSDSTTQSRLIVADSLNI